MSEGATYSVVPFINKKALGFVTGVVAAGGNIGAVSAGMLFRSPDMPWPKALLIVGLVIPASGYSIPNPPGLFLYGLLKMTGFFTPGNGGYGILAPKDTVSLILLTVMEVFFYRFYFRSAEHLAQAKKTA